MGGPYGYVLPVQSIVWHNTLVGHVRKRQPGRAFFIATKYRNGIGKGCSCSIKVFNVVGRLRGIFLNPPVPGIIIYDGLSVHTASPLIQQPSRPHKNLLAIYDFCPKGGIVVIIPTAPGILKGRIYTGSFKGIIGIDFHADSPTVLS